MSKVKNSLKTALLFAMTGMFGCSEMPVEVSTESNLAQGNSITGVGMANPNPVVTQNWGDLPMGREWGSTAIRRP